MIRGRHRGLPIAIDRAVLLPRDIAIHESFGGGGDEPEGQPEGETESTEGLDPPALAGVGDINTEEKREDEKESMTGEMRKQGSGGSGGEKVSLGSVRSPGNTGGVSFVLPDEQRVDEAEHASSPHEMLPSTKEEPAEKSGGSSEATAEANDSAESSEQTLAGSEPTRE